MDLGNLDLGLLRALPWMAAPFLLALLLRLPWASLSVDDVRWPEGVVDDRPIGGVYATTSIPDAPWVLVTGGSTAYFGVDRQALGWPSRKQTHERGFPTDVAIALAWTLERTATAQRRPAHVVWGLTMASLVDRGGDVVSPCDTRVVRERPAPERLPAGMCPPPGLVDGLADRLDPWLDRRATTRDLAVMWLRGLLGDGPPEPKPDLWYGYEGHDPAATARNTAAWERFGVFGTAEQALHPPLAAGIAQVAALCREHEVPLLLVAMPEPSDVRRRYDPGARAAFEALLADAAAAGPGVAVLDLWDAVPDDGFYDQVHVNERGRPVVTERIALALRR